MWFLFAMPDIEEPAEAADLRRLRRRGGAPRDVQPNHRGTTACSRVVGPEELPAWEFRQQRSLPQGRRTGDARQGEAPHCVN